MWVVVVLLLVFFFFYEGRKKNKSKKIQIILLFKENCPFGPEINVQKIFLWDMMKSWEEVKLL